MTVVKIMAQTLNRELLARGIRIPRADCEAIMTAVIERTAAAGRKLEPERRADG
jgi:hypothetical protein